MNIADNLARLRVAADTGRLPRDLGQWAVATLCELAPDAEVIALRNSLLCEAAELLGGTLHSRARALRAEILALGRRRSAPSEFQALIAAALDIDSSCPRSERHLRRILGADFGPLELSDVGP